MEKVFPIMPNHCIYVKKILFPETMLFHIFLFFDTKREVSQYSSTAESLKQWYEHYAEIYELGHNEENKLSKCHMEHNEQNLSIWKFIK